MKRLISLLLLLICFVQTSDAGMNAYIAGSVASAGPSCTTYSEQFTSLASTNEQQSVSTTNAAGSSFKVTSTTYIYSITVWIYTEQVDTFTLKWYNNHDMSGTVYKTVTADSTTDGAQQIEFILQDTTNQATAGTTYYFALIKSSADVATINRQDSDAYADGNLMYPDAGWHPDPTVAETYDIRFMVRACTN